MKNPQAKIDRLVAKRRATRAAAAKKRDIIDRKIASIQQRIDKVVAPLHARINRLNGQLNKVDNAADRAEAALLRETIAACEKAGISPGPYLRLDSVAPPTSIRDHTEADNLD